MDLTLERNRVRIVSRRKFVLDSSVYAVSLFFGGICNIIRSLFVAKLLGPQAFGTWSFVNIFSPYARFTSLGAQSGQSRMIPFLRGKGDVERVQAVLRTGFATNFYGSIIYSGGVLTCSLFVKQTGDARALAAFSAVILLLAWLHYAKGMSLATGLYTLRSRVEIVHAFSTLVFCVALVYFWGIYGAIAGFGIGALLALVLAIRELWEHFALRIEWRILWDLILTGLPLMANGILLTTMSNADKIVIASMLSRDMLGVYSIGLAGVSILRVIPSSFGQMLFVKFAEMDGQNKTNEQMSEALDKTTVILSALFAPILSVAIAFFPIAVVFLLPDFVRGIDAGKVLIAGVYFLSVSVPVTNLCVSRGHFMPVVILRIIVMAAEFAAIYLIIQYGGSLELIALCVLFAFAIFNGVMIVVCNHLLGRNVISGILGAGKFIVPFVSVVTGMWMQDYIYATGAYVWGERLMVSCFVGLVVSLAVAVPFAWWANRRTRFMDLLFRSS